MTSTLVLSLVSCSPGCHILSNLISIKFALAFHNHYIWVWKIKMKYALQQKWHNLINCKSKNKAPGFGCRKKFVEKKLHRQTIKEHWGFVVLILRLLKSRKSIWFVNIFPTLFFLPLFCGHIPRGCETLYFFPLVIVMRHRYNLCITRSGHRSKHTPNMSHKDSSDQFKNEFSITSIAY